MLFLLVPLSGQNLVSRQVLVPREEPKAPIPLNRRVVQMSSNELLSYIDECIPQVLIRGASCNRWWLTQRPIRDPGAGHKRLQNRTLSLKWDFYTTCLRTNGWKDCKSMKWWVNRRKRCILNTAGKLYTWAHCDCDSIQKAYVSWSRTKL